MWNIVTLFVKVFFTKFVKTEDIIKLSFCVLFHTSREFKIKSIKKNFKKNFDNKKLKKKI